MPVPRSLFVDYDLRTPARPTLAAATNSANQPEKPKQVGDDQDQAENGEAGGEGARSSSTILKFIE